MRGRAFRRHKAAAKMRRRLNEARSQNAAVRSWAAFYDTPKYAARFKEQPQRCSCESCGNQRHALRGRTLLPIQELRLLRCRGEVE